MILSISILSLEASPTCIKNNFAPKNTDNRAASKRFAFKFGENATPIPILLKVFKDKGFNF
ncbi:hypothetical protein GCM10023314_14350 [Algibacter agarivorans]|uniref:Uncharacterized protein n=1 Tax=Algibacter agarivorans TaxID=1109741 RepID=A0ABP9GJN4_9FLAO